MWDTKQSDYNIMHTPYKKDIVKALADACHKEGMGLHFYYSHLDWRRPDYPLGRTGHHTGRELKPNYQTYFNFMNAQLTELLTNYGKVDAIWFDGYWDHDQDSVPFDWRVREQYDLIHRLQPACLVGNNHHLPPMAGEDIQLSNVTCQEKTKRDILAKWCERNAPAGNVPNDERHVGI